MSMIIEKGNGTGVLPPETFGRSRRSLKLVSCILRTEKLDAVTQSLNKLNLVGGMTVTNVRGVGHEKENFELYRGRSYSGNFVSRVKVELVIESDDLDQVMKIIGSEAKTESVGDGKIFVLNVINAMRIRTSEKGVDAL